jgi:hypothetical protein
MHLRSPVARDGGPLGAQGLQPGRPQPALDRPHPGQGAGGELPDQLHPNAAGAPGGMVPPQRQSGLVHLGIAGPVRSPALVP